MRVATTDDGGAPRARVEAARWALIGLFAVNGLTLSAWLARLPAVRDALGLSPAGLGTVLVAAAVGGLAATVLAPAAVGRLGLVRSVRLTGLLFGLAYLLIGIGAAAGSLPLVGAGLLLNGVAFAGGNLPLNLGSTDVERRVGRPILPQFHAAFSIGTVVGSLLGAAAAALAVSLPAQLAVMAVVAVGWRWWAASAMLAEPRRAVGHGAARGRRAPAGGADLRPADDGAARSGGLRAALRDRRTLLIGVIALAAAVSEGAANDWLALGVVDGFGASQSLAAATFGVFVGAMTLVRLFGSRLIDRFGRVTVLRAGALVSITGVVLFVTAPSLPLAAVGVAAWGTGTALNFPIAVSAASDEPRLAALRVTVLSVFAGFAGLIEPPGLGAVGQSVGIRTAVLVVALVLVLIVVAAGTVATSAVTEAVTAAPSSPNQDAPDGTTADRADERDVAVAVARHAESAAPVPVGRAA